MREKAKGKDMLTMKGKERSYYKKQKRNEHDYKKRGNAEEVTGNMRQIGEYERVKAR